MKHYRVVITNDAKADLQRYKDYILYHFQNVQAAKSFLQDFRDTRKELENTAGILAVPDSEALQSRSLKRCNFRKHNYFLLFRINDSTVFVTNIFHFLEDYESKLR